jgi:hypothetical protein
VVHPGWGSSLDGIEELDSGLRRSSVERNKEGDGFARLRWGETKEGDAVGGARLTIEISAQFPSGIIRVLAAQSVVNYPQLLGNLSR